MNSNGLPDTILGTLDDVAYEEDIQRVTESNPDAFKVMLENYQQATLLRELSDYIPFQELMKVLEARARQAAERERAYQGTNKDKIERYRLERIKADSTVTTVRSIITEAASTPLPMYQK